MDVLRYNLHYQLEPLKIGSLFTMSIFFKNIFILFLLVYISCEKSYWRLPFILYWPIFLLANRTKKEAYNTFLRFFLPFLYKFQILEIYRLQRYFQIRKYIFDSSLLSTSFHFPCSFCSHTPDYVVSNSAPKGYCS